MSRSRRRSSTASNRTSSAAIRPMRSPMPANSSPIRLGGDAARHAGRDRCGQGCRSGRHHRLLPRRQHRVCGSDQAFRPGGGGRLLWRRRRPLRRRQAESADTTAFRRKGCRHPDGRCRDHQGQAARCRCVSFIPARSTAFIATSGRATTRPAPTSPGRAASNFLPSIYGNRMRAEPGNDRRSMRSQNQRSPTNTVSPGLIELPSGTTKRSEPEGPYG